MLAALSEEHGGRSGGVRHGNVNRRHRSATPNLVAASIVGLLGIFVATAGAGSARGMVAAIGVGMAVCAAAFGVYAHTQQRLTSKVNGTAHIVTATTPPAAATHGRCEMHLVVQAPRLTATAVKHRDQSVPVAKWPTPGGTLPVKVDPEDPRDLKILWDQVRPHGERPFGQADDLSVIADASGVSVRRPAAAPPAPDTPAAVLHEAPSTGAGPAVGRGPVIDATTVIQGEPVIDRAPAVDLTGPGASGAEAPVGGLLDAGDEPLDLSFLDPPAGHRVIDSDPLLVEYGSPIREVGVTVVVCDLQASLEFYRDLLGFFEIESGPDMVLLEARTGRVVLRQRVDAQATPPRLMHLTLEVNDIETAHRTLTKRGVEFIDEPRAVLKGELLELWAVSFHDPDGHGVALTSWRPRDEQDGGD